jgi:response regulator RpfG family c-di-GMP phosphodiesterase
MAEEQCNGKDDILFADESPKGPSNKAAHPPWKLLIADDEQDIHQITRMVLEDYAFDGRGLDFISAYSGNETKDLIRRHPDTAILLLDVVMESDDAGLEVVRHIRKNLNNPFVRIVLRTGQPGKAPERKIITTYDINDYKEKTELTSQKLFTTVTASLRAYRDLRIIEKNRRGLEQIIDSSAYLFDLRSLRRFAEGLLTQLLSILKLDESSIYLQAAGFTAAQDKDDMIILAATGKFKDEVDRSVEEVVPEDIKAFLRRAIDEQRSFFCDDAYIGYFPTQSGSKNLLYVCGAEGLSELDKDLIRIFSTNVAIAFENIYLNREIIDTQKEVILKLGDVVETRSKETANHVQRVAELSYFLALKAGLDEEEADLLRQASPMHDVGKVGVSDALLRKPGKLTDGEFEQIKAHTTIGYEILKNSARDIIQAAAIVAHQHHERWDGQGYPQGLKGEEIHLYGRITGLVDVFDALTHRRDYKEAWHMDQVLELVRKERGKRFDPRLVDLLLENLDDFLKVNDRYSNDGALGDM